MKTKEATIGRKMLTIVLMAAMILCVWAVPVSADVNTFRKGDSLYFGTDGRNRDGVYGRNDLEWIVLDKRDGMLLVMTKECIDCLPYNRTLVPVTWETSFLREWLNEDFLDRTFTKEEQEWIATVKNENPKHPRYNTSSGGATEDKVFLLSLEEAERYFITVAERKAAPSDYARSKNIYVNEDNGMSWWWLRTTSYYRDHVTYVTSEGGVSYDGREVNRTDAGVRPAMWIYMGTGS